MNLYADFEFTGLHQYTTPVSLGIVADNGKEFYCEFSDFSQGQIDHQPDNFIQEHVIDNLIFNDKFNFGMQTTGDTSFIKGTFLEISKALREWLKQFKRVEFYFDTGFYDGVLMNELLGGAHDLPDNVNYIFLDIAPLFKVHGIDPDISREAFIDTPIKGNKHSALYDAKVIQACYEKLRRNRDKYGNML